MTPAFARTCTSRVTCARAKARNLRRTPCGGLSCPAPRLLEPCSWASPKTCLPGLFFAKHDPPLPPPQDSFLLVDAVANWIAKNPQSAPLTCVESGSPVGARLDAKRALRRSASPLLRQLLISRISPFSMVASTLVNVSRVRSVSRTRCLEVGSGSGYVITSIGVLLQDQKVHAELYATDLNPSACQATTSTLESHGVRGEGARAGWALGHDARF